MSQSWLPEWPTVPAEQRGEGHASLRFEDVSQDGRLVLEALPNTLGGVWRNLAQTLHWGPAGIVPILSRVMVEGGEGPVSATGKLTSQGCYELSHTVDATGEVDRLLLGLWATVSAPLGRTHPPQPEGAGRPLVAGRIFAEHVFTRPFGPPAERKVRALDLGRGPEIPAARRDWSAPEGLLELPEGAVALEPELTADADATVFGLDHTDSNQHVNSLVYTRLFLEAALRRFARLAPGAGPLLGRSLAIAYRRPCFAGERVRLALRAFTQGGDLGAVGALVTGAEAELPLSQSRPRCYARMRFGR